MTKKDADNDTNKNNDSTNNNNNNISRSSSSSNDPIISAVVASNSCSSIKDRMTTRHERMNKMILEVKIISTILGLRVLLLVPLNTNIQTV